VPIIAAPGASGRLAVVERDVTAEKRAELQLRQSDKLRALGTLAGGVAHDFNNLLTAVLGSLELASRRLDKPKAVSRYLDNARLAAERGAALTQRLLGFSRQTEGTAEVVDVGATLSSMRELVVRTLGGGVNVDWRIEDRLWPCAIEADQFELAILNLAVNGRDAMPNGGSLTIEATNVSFEETTPLADLRPGDYVAVSVKDQGEGIEPELLQRILEPFFTTKPVGKGTGLGLAMVHGFAQRSGGALEIESEVGRGTIVRIYLPRSEKALAASANIPAEEAAGEIKTGTILVIDDEPSVRAVTAAFLRDLGHEVCEARDGATGLELLRRLRGSIDLAPGGLRHAGHEWHGLRRGCSSGGAKPPLHPADRPLRPRRRARGHLDHAKALYDVIASRGGHGRPQGWGRTGRRPPQLGASGTTSIRGRMDWRQANAAG
jgi:nitrogen-specific signal transduction histidine kinase/CheY-like chemotaxis protein